MQLKIIVDGAVVVSETLTSGDMTQEEYELGFPINMLETHTEAKAMKRFAQYLQPGARWELIGEYLPCPSCRGKMNAGARTGATITYSPGGFIAG